MDPVGGQHASWPARGLLWRCQAMKEAKQSPRATTGRCGIEGVSVGAAMDEEGVSFHALNQGNSPKLFSRTLKLCVKVPHRGYLNFSSSCCVWKEPGLQCRGADSD